jgi:predicted secreted protein
MTICYHPCMPWKSALAIYFLFWAFSVFLVLPFGVKTSEEAGVALVPGQAPSAPHEFNARRIAFRTTIVATILFGLFYLNYVNGWVTTEMLDWWAHMHPANAS